ncbi:hypothetical protein ACFT9I_03360 [Streptomyces sp. NPDC057137]|uniref:hypothetical protein n=1 Tax=Streptomyces sp. NPDC057137 TaxID=3346030 RepID=UPI0036321891
MTSGPHTLTAALGEFESAVRDQDGERCDRAFPLLHQAFQEAGPDELHLTAPRLAALLDQLPPGPRAVTAVLVGACVERGADPEPCAPGVFAGVREALTAALRFTERWTATGGGELPDPGRTELDDQVVERVGAEAAFGWWTLPEWQMASVALLNSKAVRQRVGADGGELRSLVERVQAAGGAGEEFKCLAYALRVLDDEPLVVLHRETRTAYLMRMTGIGDNFQLHTLVAGALVGGLHVPGESPSAEAIAVCRETEGQVLTTGTYNLLAPDGSWIWNEGTPSDIPVVDGARLLVLDPPPYERSWPAGRFFPGMSGDLVLERVLGQDEADSWYARVADPK